MHADPAYQAKRRAGLQRFYDQPGVREARGRQLAEGLRRYRANMTPEQRARAEAHGRWLVERFLSRPDVRARSLSPAARAKAVAAYIEVRMGWCPPELREAYHRLIRTKRMPAVEARRIIEAEIAGTREHALREIASHELASRLRFERQQREAY